jgi:DNA-binding XRE family transcriptional regulator
VKKREKQKFPNNVKKFRHEIGMKQKKLADVVHSSRRQIGRIEDGEIDPDDTLKRLIAETLSSTLQNCFPDTPSVIVSEERKRVEQGAV